MHAHITNEDTT